MVSKIRLGKLDEFERATLLMERGIDLGRRKMIVGVPYISNNSESDVGFPLVANFFTGLHALEHFYEPKAGETPREHIDIEFVSYGGDLHASFGIFDRITMVSVPVHIYVYGPCMSAGSLILQAATKRFMSPKSSLMLHYGFTADEGTSDPKRLEEVLRYHKKLMDTLVSIYLSSCNKNILTEEILRNKILPIETYLDAESCLKYGLTDEIIEPVIPGLASC